MSEPGDEPGAEVDIDPSLLADRWVGAPEQGEGEEVVFVSGERATALPPARGRQSFVLAPDGSARTLGPGPDDRPTQTSGSWQLHGRHLSVRTSTVSNDVDVVIDRLEPGRLVAHLRSVGPDDAPDADPDTEPPPRPSTEG